MIKYDTYKDSGIEWLGEIPEHWGVKRLKDVIKVSQGLQIPRDKRFHKPRLNSVPYITIPSIQGKVEEYIYKPNSNVLCTKSDILVVRTGSGVGKILTNNSGAFHNNFFKAKENKLLNFSFSFYLLTCYNTQFLIKTYAGLTAIPDINHSDFYSIYFTLPPLTEQTQIANYLDKKTNGIDRKIELLSKKISTYKELRKSLIKETALKGLDKEVKLIDSNINWLGSYPAHWQLKRIKDIFTISRGRVIAKTELKDKGLYPVYSSQTQNNGELGCIDTFDFETDLLTWTTDGANAGTVFKRAGKFSCTNICGTLIPIYKDKISLDYFVYSVQESATPNKRIDTNGAKIMSNEMSVIDIVVPPLKEQKAIANYLDEKTNKIDAIVNNIENQIMHLKELRKALINDVVTGKIKVVK